MPSSAGIGFEELAEADLVVDATYRGGTLGHSGDDPLGRLIPGAGNQGGFRAVRSDGHVAMVVLYSSGENPDWPDLLDVFTGTLTYYGDNRNPGQELHHTTRRGNELLRRVFADIHATPPRRDKGPPFLFFTRGARGRDVVFRGLAVPGAEGFPQTVDLVAVWKTKDDQRFQNYRATFTVLDVQTVSRSWITALRDQPGSLENSPAAWSAWVKQGRYIALKAPPVIPHRSKGEQLPKTALERSILRCVYEYFSGDPYAFEPCAVAIARMMDGNVGDTTVTRRSRDGGRDAVGTYRIGLEQNQILVEFALEAKCYEQSKGLGVKEAARLISRLRHRQFGILVTTSFLGEQAYRELKEDEHPVIGVSGGDIARILIKAGYASPETVTAWLVATCPHSNGAGV
jgi:hypothetical protein